MPAILKLIIWFLFIFFIYHLVRDILQDVLGIYHPLLDINHREPVRGTKLLGNYFKFWAFPFELGVIILSLKSLTSNDFGIRGIISVILFLFFISIWVFTSFKL